MYTRHGFVEVNGARLAYEVAGAGYPLVLIHGTTLDTRMWEDQFELFAQHYQVIRYDRRGFGRSALPTESYTHAGDLAALLASLDVHFPVLLGHSTGGGVALDFALAHPTPVRALILYESVLGGYRFAPEFGAYLGSVRTLAQHEGLAAARERWLEPLAAQLLDKPRALERLRQMVHDYSGWHWVNDDLERAASTPALQQLGRLDLPTLIVVGERTVPDMRRIAAILEREIPRARRVMLSHAGHMANMELPETFNHVILDFLAECCT
jgi:pimeloyl-ACP methyl ester carboxylesterase